MCPISKTHVVVQRLARLSFKGSIHKTTTKQQSKFWNFLVIVVDLLEKMTFFGWKFSTTKFFTPIPRKKSTNPKFPPVFNNLTHSTPANSDPNFSAPQKKIKLQIFASPPPKKKHPETETTRHSENRKKKKRSFNDVETQPVRVSTNFGRRLRTCSNLATLAFKSVFCCCICCTWRVSRKAEMWCVCTSVENKTKKNKNGGKKRGEGEWLFSSDWV